MGPIDLLVALTGPLGNANPERTQPPGPPVGSAHLGFTDMEDPHIPANRVQNRLR